MSDELTRLRIENRLLREMLEVDEEQIHGEWGVGPRESYDWLPDLERRVQLGMEGKLYSLWRCPDPQCMTHREVEDYEHYSTKFRPDIDPTPTCGNYKLHGSYSTGPRLIRVL